MTLLFIHIQGDVLTSLLSYTKNKTFNEQRRDLFFESQKWCKNNYQLITMFVNVKKGIKTDK